VRASQLQLSWGRDPSPAVAAYFVFALSCCDLAKHENNRASLGGCPLGWVPSSLDRDAAAREKPVERRVFRSKSALLESAAPPGFVACRLSNSSSVHLASQR